MSAAVLAVPPAFTGLVTRFTKMMELDEALTPETTMYR
jgi:hypothetical protein